MGHGASGDEHATAAVAGFAFAHADAAERWVDVHGVDGHAVGEFAVAVSGVVVPEDLAVVHRCVGERAGAVDVADGVDVFDVGLHGVIDGDVAALVGFDAGGVEGESVAVRCSPDGE